MPEQFNASAIKPIRWGQVSRRPDGGWLTSWNLELEAVDPNRLEEAAAAATDTRAGFRPRLAWQGGNRLAVTVETTRWGMELDYYDLTYRLWKLIDAGVGRIVSIEGTPRDWWQPFRST